MSDEVCVMSDEVCVCVRGHVYVVHAPELPQLD